MYYCTFYINIITNILLNVLLNKLVIIIVIYMYSVYIIYNDNYLFKMTYCIKFKY